MKFNDLGSVIAKSVAAGMLLGALDRHPYAYYTLPRWVVCGVSALAAFRATELKKVGWAWLLAGTALLFNPFAPVHLSRELRKLVDTVAAALLLASLVVERPRPDHEGNT